MHLENKMRICILGNSHLGALKRAWDRIGSEYDNIAIDFFGGRSNTLSGLVVENDCLVASNQGLKRSIEFTSGGISSVDPELYDVFLVYGLGFHLRGVPLSKGYSSAFLRDFARERFASTISYYLVSGLRTITGKVTYVGHVPLSADYDEAEVSLTDDYTAVFDVYKNVIEDMVERVFLVRQPEETILNGRSTKSEFSKNSKRMAVGASNDNALHPETDIGHMNDDFGELWLRNFLKQVA